MPAARVARENARAFGDALRRRRKEKGLSQTTLAERTGHAISRQQISLLERGLSGGRSGAPGNPEWATVLLLCTALDARLVVDIAHPVGISVRFVDAGNTDSRTDHTRRSRRATRS